MSYKVGDQVVASDGLIGEITEVREGGYFIKPINVAYKIRDEFGITGVANALLLTPTFWAKRNDGKLHGLWYDSPFNNYLTIG